MTTCIFNKEPGSGAGSQFLKFSGHFATKYFRFLGNEFLKLASNV